MRDSMGVDLSAEDAAALGERTEGWVAGLQMAALALRASALQGADRASLSQHVERFSGRHHLVLDYLTDEVLRRQPEPVQDFLLHTCILEQMCGELCDWVQRAAGAGEDADFSTGSRHLLERLEHANLFVVPLDEERTWYRYHRLFAELLRTRLQATRPEIVPELHRCAAEWYERAGRSQEAVQHALQSGDIEHATQMIERLVRSRTGWTRIDGANLLRWMRALPQDVLDARPRFRILAARALYVTGQRARAESSLRALERKLRQQPASPAAQATLEQIATDRASYAALHGQVRAAKAWAEPVLARLGGQEPTVRMRAASVLGLAYMRAGEVAEASRAFQDAIAATEQAGIPAASVAFWCNLAEAQFVQGRLRQALQSCQRGEQADTLAASGPGRAPQPTLARGFVYLNRSKIAYERYELEAASRFAEQGLDLLRRGRISLGTETLYALLACIRQALGEGEGAEAAIDQSLQIARGNDIPRLLSLVSAYQARLLLAQKRLDAAARWAESYVRSEETEYLREAQELTLARVYLALGNAAKTESVLDRLLAPARAAGRQAAVIEGLALRALVQSTLGRHAAALEDLDGALSLAEPEGYVRLFVDAGAPMAALLTQIRPTSRTGSSGAYVRRLLAACADAEPRSRPQPDRPPSDLLLDPLTARELDVLDLLAQNLTNAEIAQQLVISLPTVKSHTRNLYGKLDVHNRRAAVARARELGLLD
jgi:LuxR family maltose regulon positive regulatory protein